MHASATALRRPGSGIRPESSAPGIGLTYVGQGRISLHVTVVRRQEDSDLVPVSSPRVGRWLSNDPIGISGGLNQYAAFGNNPVIGRDPDGRAAVLLVLPASAVAGAKTGGIAGAISGFQTSQSTTRGGLVWDTISGGLSGALGGGVGGGIAGVQVPGTSTLGGMAGAAVSSIANDLLHGRLPDTEKLAWSTGMGGVAGFAGEFFGPASPVPIGLAAGYGTSIIHFLIDMQRAAEAAQERRDSCRDDL